MIDVSTRTAKTLPPPPIEESSGELFLRASELRVQATRLIARADELERVALARIKRRDY
jgi:hypothetical protein